MPGGGSPLLHPRFAGPAVLFVSLALAGCSRPPAPAVREAYADMSQLQAVHPDWPLLRGLDARIAAAQRAGLPVPPATELPPLEMEPVPPPESLGAPDLSGARARAERELADTTAALEPLARAEAEDEYAADLRRLQVEIGLARAEPPAVDLETYQEAVRAAGEELARLEAQAHALRPSPATDRYFYSAAQVRRRSELHAQVRLELQALREAQVARLRERLAPSERETLTVPAARVAALARDRDARYTRVMAELSAREEEARAALANSPPDWEAAGQRGWLAWATESREPPALAGTLQRAVALEIRDVSARRQEWTTALLEWRRGRALLARRVGEETETRARDLARELGLQIADRASPGLPDVTSRLRVLMLAGYRTNELAVASRTAPATARRAREGSGSRRGREPQ